VERNDYTAVAKSFHWLIALLIFVQFPLAWVMDDFSGIQKFKAYNLHKSLGITVLALMVLRVLWRLARPSPSLPATMPKLERTAAHLGHFLLYTGLFLMPLSGWAMISSSDKPSVLYQYTAFPLISWLSNLPAAEKKGYEVLFINIHAIVAYVLLVLIGIHIAAALRHAILLKDGIFSRMLPRVGRGSGTARAVSIAFIAGTLGLGGVPHARATEWGVNPQKSQVGFEAYGSGYTAKGTFGRFKTDIEFDPDTPEQTSIKVSLDMHSVATGTADVDSTLQSADYFDPAKYPTAEFVARGAKPDGEGKYVLNGRLTLKGVTKPVSLPFSIDIKSGTATVKAETKINRLDFGVGPESVAGLAIDKDVLLKIDLTALRLDN
jgi:cytochrome b561/polyisoprenoid-binding protein YceI